MGNTSARVSLISTEAVRAVFGCAAGTVRARVDDATRPDHLRWVFNLAVADGRKRALRFWFREVQAPESCARLTLGAVVDLILGRRQHFLRGELAIEWTLHPTTVSNLLRTGALSLTDGLIPRAALDRFLRARWITGCQATKSTRWIGGKSYA